VKNTNKGGKGGKDLLSEDPVGEWKIIKQNKKINYIF
jgi:hypothetical protein